MTDDARCEIELVDANDFHGMLICDEIRINGQRILCPKGTTFKLECGDMQPVTLTMEVFPTKFTIHKATDQASSDDRRRTDG